MERSRWARLADWLWFFFFAAASSIWCLTAANEVGVTFDEPVYMNGGLHYWRTGSHSELFKLGTMPLPMDIATLPLYVWERTHDITFDFHHGNPYEPLFWARATSLLFWWVLLYYGRRIGRSLAGPWGGRLAVALLAVEPTLLAHAALATTDLPITACMAAFVYHFRAGRDRPWLPRVGWPALWFAIALLTKASAIAFAPLCMLAIELERLARNGLIKPRAESPAGSSLTLRLQSAWSNLQPLRRDGIQMAAIGIVLVFLYGGSDWRPQPSFVSWSHTLPDGPLATATVWTAEHVCIFGNAGEPIVRQVLHNFRGHGAYLLGRADPVRIWYYFPVALSMKLTVPLLALPILLALIRPRSLANWACLTAGVLLVYSVQCRVQIGVRLVLPLVGIGVAGLAAALVNAWCTLPVGPRKLLLGVAIPAGLLWSAIAAINVWPHGLCFVNEVWGGTDSGYRIVSDGNYDWGQGVRDLARWQRDHADLPLEVLYFGTDSAINELPARQMSFFDVISLKTPEDVERAMRGRYIAVSMTVVYGPMTGIRPIWEYLQTQQPVARTQTFLIYDFR